MPADPKTPQIQAAATDLLKGIGPRPRPSKSPDTPGERAETDSQKIEGVRKFVINYLGLHQA